MAAEVREAAAGVVAQEAPSRILLRLWRYDPADEEARLQAAFLISPSSGSG